MPPHKTIPFRHPTEQSISIPKGLYEKELIFFNQFTFILYREKVTWNEKNYISLRGHILFFSQIHYRSPTFNSLLQMVDYTKINQQSIVWLILCTTEKARVQVLYCIMGNVALYQKSIRKRLGFSNQYYETTGRTPNNTRR